MPFRNGGAEMQNESKTRPQDKWDAKAGLIPKTYKVNKEVAEEFQRLCKAQGIAMGKQLTKMMNEFIKEVNDKDTQ